MNNLELFGQITTLIFDVDGVFTNSELLITEEGHLLRTMNTRDGYAVKMALKAGYNVAIITGGNSLGVSKRLERLGIEDIYSGSQNKIEAFNDYLSKKGLSTDEILYMGDDLPDYEVMTKVALPVCPNDADPMILELSKYISSKAGGKGCVRDVIERIMRLNDQWKTVQS